MIGCFCAVYPKYNKGLNYYQEFWRTYLMNEMMISKIKEFSSDNKLLDVKIVELEVNLRGMIGRVYGYLVD